MSGHSKWATTHRQKAVADNKRGAVFTKMAKNITVAARLGGGDPAMNFRLRLAVDMAKGANMPKDNIERAIKRGTGELAGENIETVVYEGYGPGTCAIIIEALTDNRNRTAANVKHMLTKYGGSFGAQNSVMWQFDHKGVIQVSGLSDEQELLAIDAGADDIERHDAGAVVLTSPNNLQAVKTALEQAGITISRAEVEYVPKDTKALTDEEQTTWNKLIDELEDDLDVNNYYTNAELA